MNNNGLVLDIEADGFIFESTKIWTICGEDLDSDEKWEVKPFEVGAKQALKFLEAKFGEYDKPNIVFHNGLGYDIFVMLKILGMNFQVGKKHGDTIMGQPVQFIDTYYWSMFLNPDRQGHSIEAWGDILGLPKIDYRARLIELGVLKKDAPKGKEFSFYHPEMSVYCPRDVSVNKLAYQAMQKEHKALYQSLDVQANYKAGQKSFFLMSCQGLAGWKFDIEKAKELAPKIDAMSEQVRAEVEPELPTRPLKKGEQKDYTMPAKPFKKDGTLSATMLNWIEKHNGRLIGTTAVEILGKCYKIEAGRLLDVELKMEMADQMQMKDWLLSLGWEPTLWNFKRGEDGKPERDPKTRQLIQTTPKIQEQGKICPNLEAMDMPIIKKVVRWLSLRNRRSVLQGWLDNPRLEYDGRLETGRSGIAATHRQKHKITVNVPKASKSVLLGYEFRELFTSEEGFWLAAGDAAALEGRSQGHYTYRYDDGATARDLLDGDVHSKTAKSVYADVLESFDINSPDFNKDDPAFKPYRDRSKNIFYATLYGAGDAKIAKTAGLPESRGKEVSEAFWEANSATKALKDNLEQYWTTKGNKKYLPAVDGRWLCTRKKSALLNTIFQSLGGIAMDYAGCFMDSWLGEIYFDEKFRPYYLLNGKKVRRIGYFHDEYEFECEGEDTANEVARMIEKSIEKAGEFLKIAVPLKGEGKVGKNWKEVH